MTKPFKTEVLRFMREKPRLHRAAVKQFGVKRNHGIQRSMRNK